MRCAGFSLFQAEDGIRDAQESRGFKQKTAYEMLRSLVGSEMCIRDRDRISQILSTILKDALASSTGIISQVIPNIPLYVVELIIVTLLLYYILLRGHDLLDEMVTLVPTAYQKDLHQFLQHLQRIYYSLYVVNLGTSLVSGIFAAVGYAILGVPYFCLLYTSPSPRDS